MHRLRKQILEATGLIQHVVLVCLQEIDMGEKYLNIPSLGENKDSKIVGRVITLVASSRVENQSITLAWRICLLMGTSLSS